MSETPTPPSPASPPPAPNADQRFSARVPDRVARGVTATGILAFGGPNEVVIDFLQVISKPANLITRVVMTPMVADQFVGVLRENLSRYEQQFGTPPAAPKPPANEKPRSPQEIYDEVKVPEEIISGVYANTVIVGHTPFEFGIDFITSFLPHASVSARVYMAAPRVPQLIDTLAGLIAQYKRQPPLPPPAAPEPPPPPKGFGTAPGIPGFPAPPQN